MVGQIIVTLCFLCCLGQAQDFYEAEEHSNVTLTWIFPANVDMHPQQLTAHIFHVKTWRCIYLYDSRGRGEWYPNELYRGRLHCHPQLLSERRIDCVLTNLSCSDVGMYECILGSNGKTESSQLCGLNLTEVSKPENEPLRSTSRKRTACYVVLVLFLVVAVAHILYFLNPNYKCHSPETEDLEAMKLPSVHHQSNDVMHYMD